MMMLGERLSAEQAVEWGLIYKAVEDDQLMDEVGAMASKFATGPTKAYAFIRKALSSSANNTYDQQLDLEYLLQTRASKSYDFGEGVAAFREKRQAKFEGR